MSRVSAVCIAVSLILGQHDLFAQAFCEQSKATHCFDFDETDIDGATYFGVAKRVTSEDEDAYLSINDNANWQDGSIVLPPLEGTNNRIVIGGRTGAANSNHHLDNIELEVNGDDFAFAAQARIGGGTRHPADGFSVNYARPDDPVFEDGSSWAEIAAHRFPEEGTQTGLAVGFDEWDANEPWDVPGISIRHNDVVLKQFAYPEFNAGAKSQTSIQTGPSETELPLGPVADSERTQSTGIPLSDLAWVPVRIQRDGQQLSIEFKENAHKLTIPLVNVDCNASRVVEPADVGCSNSSNIGPLLSLLDLALGDFDLNGSVEFQDFLILSSNFGNLEQAGVYTNGDSDLNGAIEFQDFLNLAANFGTTSQATTVPEPDACVLLLASLLARHRRVRDEQPPL